MHRTENYGNVNNLFVDGPPASTFSADMANAIQEEIANVIEGSNIQLFAGGGSSYDWSPGTGLSDSTISNPVASPLITTTYQIIVSDTCRSDTGFVTITIPVLIGQFPTDTTICSGQPVQLFAGGGTTYSWSPNTGIDDPTSANPIFSPSVTTTYTLIISDICGSDTAQVTITVNPLPSVNAGPDQSVVMLGCWNEITIIGYLR